MVKWYGSYMTLDYLPVVCPGHSWFAYLPPFRYQEQKNHYSVHDAWRKLVKKNSRIRSIDDLMANTYRDLCLGAGNDFCQLQIESVYIKKYYN